METGGKGSPVVFIRPSEVTRIYGDGMGVMKMFLVSDDMSVVSHYLLVQQLYNACG